MHIFDDSREQPTQTETLREVFTQIYSTNGFNGSESVSGPGSSILATTSVRAGLLKAFAAHSIRSVLDIGCGDYNWFGEIRSAIETYLGVDIVEELVHRNETLFGSSSTHFVVGDATRLDLPRYDAIVCRDVMGHLPTADGLETIDAVNRSGARLFFATTFPDVCNSEMVAGGWRPVNLSAAPYNLGPPTLLIGEDEVGQHASKRMGCWELTRRSA